MAAVRLTNEVLFVIKVTLFWNTSSASFLGTFPHWGRLTKCNITARATNQMLYYKRTVGDACPYNEERRSPALRVGANPSFHVPNTIFACPTKHICAKTGGYYIRPTLSLILNTNIRCCYAAVLDKSAERLVKSWFFKLLDHLVFSAKVSVNKITCRITARRHTAVSYVKI